MASGGLKCPICGKPVLAKGPSESPCWPFCTPQCRLIDLGKWVTGDYRIPSRPVGSDEPRPREDGDEPGPRR